MDAPAVALESAIPTAGMPAQRRASGVVVGLLQRLLQLANASLILDLSVANSADGEHCVQPLGQLLRLRVLLVLTLSVR